MIRLLTVVCIVSMLSCVKTSFAQVALLAETCLTDNKYDNRYASYSPNGERIIFESNRDGNWEIYMMDSNGSNVIRLTENDYEDRRPSWHPNGKKILFESNREGVSEMYTLRLKNKKICQITDLHDMGTPMFGNYSPNGKYIAIGLQETDDRSNIYILNKKGKLIRSLTESDYRNAYPRWSNDGGEILYFSRNETSNKDDEIYKLNVNTGKETRLTNWPKHNFCPSWSADNKRIAYVTSMEGTRPEIYIMNANGEQQTRITQNEDGDTLPTWSPDGNKLLITAYRNGSYQICELLLSGS